MAVVVKPKRRNSEKRKEKSRDAARSRRSKETEVFCQLARELPVSYNVLAQLDKASIVRLGITHLKLRKLFENAAFDQSVAAPSALQQKADHLFCRALDGFLMLANKDGSVVYITENVISHLGLTQMDLLGHSVYDFIHPCDHDEMQDVISNRNNGDGKNLEHSLFLRMKCTLTSKGRSVNIKSASYKVIHCTGSTMSKEQQQLEPLNLTKGDSAGSMAFTLLMCHPIPNPSNTDIMLDSRTFVSHHNMDMTFISCDERISNLLGFKAEELVGRSLYEYHHALDSETLEKSFKTLFAKGQCITGLYRFLVKSGGYVWVETQSSIVNSPRSEKAQFVVCINLVVSGVECSDEIFSTVQQQGSYLDVGESREMVSNEEEVEEVDIEEVEEEEEEEEEMDENKEGLDDDDDEDAMFVTEQILTMARQDFSQPSKHGLLDSHSSVDKSMSPFFKPQVPEPGPNVYEQIAPFISLDDTVFDSVVPTSNGSEKSFNQSYVDPDLDRQCILRHQSALLTSFNDLTDPKEMISAGAGNLLMSGLQWEKDVESIMTSFPSPPLSNNKLTGRQFVEQPGSFFPDRQQQQAFGIQKLIQTDAVSALSGSSVLKNLLVKGVDVNYGYRLVESSSDFGVVPHKGSYAENGSMDKASFSSVLHQLLCVQGDSRNSS